MMACDRDDDSFMPVTDVLLPTPPDPMAPRPCPHSQSNASTFLAVLEYSKRNKKRDATREGDAAGRAALDLRRALPPAMAVMMSRADRTLTSVRPWICQPKQRRHGTRPRPQSTLQHIGQPIPAAFRGRRVPVRGKRVASRTCTFFLESSRGTSFRFSADKRSYTCSQTAFAHAHRRTTRRLPCQSVLLSYRNVLVRAIHIRPVSRRTDNAHTRVVVAQPVIQGVIRTPSSSASLDVLISAGNCDDIRENASLGQASHASPSQLTSSP